MSDFIIEALLEKWDDVDFKAFALTYAGYADNNLRYEEYDAIIDVVGGVTEPTDYAIAVEPRGQLRSDQSRFSHGNVACAADERSDSAVIVGVWDLRELLRRRLLHG